MKMFMTGAIVAGILSVAALPVQAQTNLHTPGAQMQEKGSVAGTAGASGYAPGQQMKAKGSVKGTTGASGYAPGHATTGAAVNTDANVKAGGIKAGAKVKTDAKVKVN
jgi:hypothetical protein